MKNKTISLQAAVCLLILSVLLFLFSSNPVTARTFPVNSGFDVNNLTPGNGLCVAYIVVMPPFVLPFCTLRAAIEEANAFPGTDIITLGSGTYKLSIEGIGEDVAVTGDLDITDSVHIVGAGADKTFIDARGIDRVFDIFGQTTIVTLSGVTVRGGNLPAGLATAQKGGGGIRNKGRVSISSVQIEKNTVGATDNEDGGGGVYNTGECWLTDSTLTENKAIQGGGIMNAHGGSLHITATTIVANQSLNGAGISNDGTTEAINSTFSGNGAWGWLTEGGAVYNHGKLHLTQCTIAENSSDFGGGIFNYGLVFMANTLLSGNQGGNCFSSGGIDSNGHNLDTDDTCGLTELDLRHISPLLGPLQDNGGPTLTHALNPGSPAIDAGTVVAGLTSDQRGFSRPQRLSFDIGAVEAYNISILPCIAPLLLQ